MYAVIGGMGHVGFQLAQSLYDEGYHLAVIDGDRDALARAEAIDAMVIRAVILLKELQHIIASSMMLL